MSDAPEERDGEVGEIYSTLRAIAESHMRRLSPGQTLQATALVHEAYIKIAEQEHLAEADRTQLLATMSVAMRRVIIDHLRHRERLKRGGGWARSSIDPDNFESMPTTPEQLLAVAEAIEELKDNDPRKAEVVTMRHFAGMTFPEISQALGVSLRTVERDWEFARAWLFTKLVKPG